jgi:hypothetical protein
MAVTPEARQRDGLPDWRTGAYYEDLFDVDLPGMAWEWLRRNSRYRSAWRIASRDRAAPVSQSFGLERYENPCLAAPDARPIWSSSICGDVLRAHVSDPFAPYRDRVDLRLLSRFVTVAIGADEVEHLLLSDGRHSLRIDVEVGTLIGCPASLTYLLHGISGLKGPIGSLERLAKLITTGCFSTQPASSIDRRRRWLQELRVADAIAEGCDQQTIARVLFNDAIAPSRWRIENGSYRRRVQRLVLSARSLLANPLPRWFAGS